MTLTDYAYGAFCSRCGMLAGSSKNDDFHQDVCDIAADHLTSHIASDQDEPHKVHIKKLPRSL